MAKAKKSFLAYLCKKFKIVPSNVGWVLGLSKQNLYNTMQPNRAPNLKHLEEWRIGLGKAREEVISEDDFYQAVKDYCCKR